MTLFNRIRAGLGIAIFLTGFLVFVVSERAAQTDITVIGFAIMLMGGGAALVPDNDPRNG